MNKPLIAISPVFLALALAGCGSAADPSTPDDAIQPIVPPAAAVDELDAGLDPNPFNAISPECKGPGRPVIVPTSDGDCTLALSSSWTAVNLFENGSAGVQALTLSVPGHMNYCRFEYTESAPSQREIDDAYDELGTAVMGDAQLDETGAGFDCRAFGPSANVDPLVQAALTGINDSFMVNIGALDASELQSLSLDPVQLRLIDTASEAGIFNQAIVDLHGLRLEAMIDDIACAGASPCKDQIEQIMALPRQAMVGAEDFDHPDWSYGGKVGYWSDLALGIYEAVQGWREYNAAKADPFNDHERLVLNLSIGGVPETATPDSGPEAAVVDALKMAACYGVVVVTAAGNRSDLACDSEDGMLAPAVFEAMSRPTQAECDLLGFTPDWDTQDFPVFDPGPDTHPLVYAIAGTDEYDEPLANSRVDSFSRLVATGVGLPSNNHPQFDNQDLDDIVLTGSSVAAAVTSAAAMTVWGYDPSMRPDVVMQHLYDGSYNLGGSAVGFYAGEDIHRLSLCGALVDAGANVPGCVVGPADQDGNLGGFFTAIDAYHTWAQGQGVDHWFEHKSNNGVAVPMCQPEELFPGVEPQPEKPTCALCGVEIGDLAAPDPAFPDSLQMSMTWIGEGTQDDIDEGNLYLYGPNDQFFYMPLDAATRTELNQKPPASVVKVYFNAGFNPTKAMLELKYELGSVEETVLHMF